MKSLVALASLFVASVSFANDVPRAGINAVESASCSSAKGRKIDIYAGHRSISAVIDIRAESGNLTISNGLYGVGSASKSFEFSTGSITTYSMKHIHIESMPSITRCLSSDETVKKCKGIISNALREVSNLLTNANDEEKSALSCAHELLRAFSNALPGMDVNS